MRKRRRVEVPKPAPGTPSVIARSGDDDRGTHNLDLNRPRRYFVRAQHRPQAGAERVNHDVGDLIQLHDTLDVAVQKLDAA